jgi:iron(III) transport system permease protein
MAETMGSSIKKNIIHYLLTAILLLVLLLPVLMVLFDWLKHALKAHALSFPNPDTLLLVINSLFLSATVALLATIIGTCCGFILYKTRLQGRQIYRLLLIVPLLVSPYIFAVAWKDLLFLVSGSATSVYSTAGVVVVHTLIYFPLALLITGNAFSNISSGLEDAGLMIVSFRRMIMKILLPLIRPAITASFLLIFIFSLGDFSVPAFLGVKTFTVEIFTQFSAFYNYNTAITQSMLLVGACLILLTLEARYISMAAFLSVSTKGSNSKIYEVTDRRYILHSSLIVILIFSMLLPLFILLFQSLTGREIVLGNAWQLLKPAVFQSVKLAFLGALLISIIGLYVGYRQARLKSAFANLLLLILFILPSTILGIALIRFYNQPQTGFIYNSAFIILLGYISKYGFIVSRISANGLRQIPVSLEEAAELLGAGPVSRLIKILLPLLSSSLFVSFVLAFVLCLGEIGTTIMVYPPGTELMPIKIFTISANAPQAFTSSMTLISLMITLLFIMLFFMAGKLIFNKNSHG